MEVSITCDEYRDYNLSGAIAGLGVHGLPLLSLSQPAVRLCLRRTDVGRRLGRLREEMIVVSAG